MTIDTLEFAKRLEKAGISREQAEAHAEALRAAIASEVATKADLDATSHDIRGDFHGLRGEFHNFRDDIRRDFNGLRDEFQKLRGRVDVLTWMASFNLAATMAVLWKLPR